MISAILAIFIFTPVPTNLVSALIPSEPLKKSLPPSSSSPHPLLLPTSSLPKSLSENDDEPEIPPATAAAVHAITQLFSSSKTPILLIDALAERLACEDLVLHLAQECGLKIFVSPMGKGTVWEGGEWFGGVYAGSVTLGSVKEVVESADLVIDVGPLKVRLPNHSFPFYVF